MATFNRRSQTEIWKKEQLQLKQDLILEFPIRLKEKLNDGNLLVGGMDISFFKEDPGRAVVCLATISMRTLRVSAIYFTSSVGQIPLEQEGYQKAIDSYISLYPNHLPDVLMVDGQGTLHPRGFGLACHVGVISGIPTFGVAKEILQWDTTRRLTREERQRNARETRRRLRNSPPTEIDNNGMIICLGKAVNPVYISPGHLIDRKTAVEISKLTAKARIPEPTRQADRLSRKYVDEILLSEMANLSIK